MTDPFDPNPRRYLSVSQLKQYERCPYSYYLARIKRSWQRPAAWLPQGSAVHAVAEEYRRRQLSGRPMSLEEAQELFGVEYQKEVNEYAAITPNFEWWSKSGPYDGKKDIERRYGIGREQVEKFVNWVEGHPHEAIWIAEDGTPGIELGFDIELDGILIRGFIDAVIQVSDGFGDVVIVRDYKTGNNPGDDFQLGVYKVALEEQFDVFAGQGDYWMGRPGKPTYPFDLRDWTRESVGAKFGELEENVRAKRFDPDPEPDKCKFCDVSYACEFALG